jgi:hypothetical protein
VDDGIDSMEIQHEAVMQPSISTVVSNTQVRLTQSGILASILTAGAAPASDYASDYFVHTHPCVFPNGTGCRPDGMPPDVYLRTLMQRYPEAQYAGNRPFLVNVYDSMQRHQVNTHAGVVLHTHTWRPSSTTSLRMTSLRR